MKHYLKPVLYIFAWAVMAMPALSYAETDIDGWGNLKFGMSVEEARKAEPRLDGETEDVPCCIGPPTAFVESNTATVEISGREYRLKAYFDVNERYDLTRLASISLIWENALADYVSTKECERIYQEHLRLVIRKYGEFDDLYKNNPFAKFDDVDKKKSQIKETVDGRANYYEKHFTELKDFSFEARKTLPDSKRISVYGTPTRDGKQSGTCRARVTFYKELPAYVPDLPKESESGETF
mgnify:CR=1 FL=1